MGCWSAGLARDTTAADAGEGAGNGGRVSASIAKIAVAVATQLHRQALVPQQSSCEAGAAGDA